MKHCNNKECNVELIVGENWYPSMVKSKQYRCKTCHKGVNKEYNEDHPGRIKQYYQDNKTNFIKIDKKLKMSIEPGIYAIYNKDELIYIGESGKPYQRVSGHFTKYKNLKHAKTTGNVSYALSIGELERVNLTFKMWEFIDDTPTREAREKCLIQRYKPIYNDLYL